MPHTRVSRDQFERHENSVRHVPTGAQFFAYPGEPDPHRANWGRVGDVLEGGNDFARDEVLKVAAELLAERMAT